MLVIESTEPDAALSPDPDGEIYELFFELPGSPETEIHRISRSSDPEIQLNIDLINADGNNNAANAEINTDWVLIVKMAALSSGHFIGQYDFKSQSYGWVFKTNPLATGHLPATGSYVAGQGLRITGGTTTGNHVTYGWWENPGNQPPFSLEADKVYRLDYFVTSSAIDKTRVPVFRLRINGESWRVAGLVNVNSTDSNSRIPTAGTIERYSLYLRTPKQLANQNENVLLSFDYLQHDAAGNDDPSTIVTLQKIEVYSFDAPAPANVGVGGYDLGH
jgi:hypothetical protein